MPSREPGGKIFIYCTGRCDRDPWLLPSTCDRFGGHVPDDVREALRRIDHERFPLTWKAISPFLKQQLVKQHQQVNQQMSQGLNHQQNIQAMMIQPQPSQAITQSQRTQAMTVQPQAAIPKPNTGAGALARSGIFARGVEEKEGQSAAQQERDAQADQPNPAEIGPRWIPVPCAIPTTTPAP